MGDNGDVEEYDDENDEFKRKGGKIFLKYFSWLDLNHTNQPLNRPNLLNQTLNSLW